MVNILFFGFFLKKMLDLGCMGGKMLLQMIRVSVLLMLLLLSGCFGNGVSTLNCQMKTTTDTIHTGKYEIKLVDRQPKELYMKMVSEYETEEAAKMYYNSLQDTYDNITAAGITFEIAIDDTKVKIVEWVDFACEEAYKAYFDGAEMTEAKLRTKMADMGYECE